jgi:hypothetical protein
VPLLLLDAKLNKYHGYYEVVRIHRFIKESRIIGGYDDYDYYLSGYLSTSEDQTLSLGLNT